MQHADKFRKAGVDINLQLHLAGAMVQKQWIWIRRQSKLYGDSTVLKDLSSLSCIRSATHAQKGLPAFGIYGHDVQEADDTSIPDDVKEKLLRFGRAAVAAASMRGKSYLQIGSVTMGIGGSIIDSDFIESYLGMRVESVDEVEIIRRMTEGIYDHAEFEKALKWAKETCKIGWDKNPEELQFSPEKKEEQFELVKMAVIIKELMNGCDNLDPHSRRSNRTQCSGSWFPGTETVDRLLSER